MQSHIPTPRIHAGTGNAINGFLITANLGRGWESTSYLATEAASGVLRRLKFYRPSRDWPPDFLGHTAATFDLLHPTGAVPAYHHMDVWQRNRREEIPYLVLGYINGVPLTKMLDRQRWRRTWRPEQALRLVASMARRIAAVHALGRALGDFEYGNNVMILADGSAMWCDLGPGSPELPNDWYEGDRIDFFTTLDRLLTLQPVAPAVERVARAIGRWRGCRVRQQTFERISAVLDDFEASGWDRAHRRGIAAQNKTRPTGCGDNDRPTRGPAESLRLPGQGVPSLDACRCRGWRSRSHIFREVEEE